MADHEDISGPKDESFIDNIKDKIHGGDDSSSSSDSDSDEKKVASPKVVKEHSPIQDKIYRVFGRQKPVHHVLGGGKPADVFLWRNKKVSASVLGGATAIWVIFELLEYHLLTFVCHSSILALSLLFLWSNASVFIKKKPAAIPEVRVPEGPVIQIASALRIEINRAFAVLREIAAGRDLKKFLIVVAGLWFLSILGSCCNFLTLSYILFVLLHIVPVVFEKYDDKIDAYAEKAMAEIKKQYAVLDEKVLCKIPMGPLKKKNA